MPFWSLDITAGKFHCSVCYVDAFCSSDECLFDSKSRTHAHAHDPVNQSSVLFQANTNSIFLYDIDVNTIKQAGQVLLLILFLFTLLSFLAHITFAFRYRYSWHRLSTGVKNSISTELSHISSFPLDSVPVSYLCFSAVRHVRRYFCK